MNEKLTKDDAIAWAKMLSPGDNVIFMQSTFHGDEPHEILTVEKVTPSGIVRTNKGSFRQDRCEWISRFMVKNYGNDGLCGEIVPYTDELAEKAAEHQRKRKEEMQKISIINRAKSICYDFYYNKREMTFELAKSIIEIAEQGAET